MFLLSLLSMPALYLFRWGTPAADASTVARAAAINLALFTMFALHHSIMARTGAKRWITTIVPADLERSVYVWIASVLFLATCWLWQRLPGAIWHAGSLGGLFAAAGPFAIVRHPIYLGWVLMVFGTPVMTTTRLLFAVISTVYLIVAIPLEERALIDAHGREYETYQRAMRWRLVPGIW